MPYRLFYVIASPSLRVILRYAQNLMALRTGSAKQSHSCPLPPRLLQHCVPRNDERRKYLPPSTTLEKEGCVIKVVDEYKDLTIGILMAII